MIGRNGGSIPIRNVTNEDDGAVLLPTVDSVDGDGVGGIVVTEIDISSIHLHRRSVVGELVHIRVSRGHH